MPDLSEHGSVQQKRARRICRTIALLCVGVVAVGIAIYLLIPPYAVRVDCVTAWDDPNLNQTYPKGTSLQLTLRNRWSRNLADVEVLVDEWHDSAGNDLLLHDAVTCADRDFNYYQVHASAGKEGHGGGAVVVPFPGSHAPASVSIALNTPRQISPGATASSVKGRVHIVEGRSARTLRIASLPVAVGSSFFIAGHAYVLREVSTVNRGPETELLFETDADPDPVYAIQPLDEYGHEIAAAETFSAPGLQQKQTIPARPGEPARHLLSVRLPAPALTLTFVVRYWGALISRDLPFATCLPVGHKPADPFASMRPSISELGPRLPFTPVTPADWGAELKPPAGLRPLTADAPQIREGRSAEMTTLFHGALPAPIISYSATVTAICDNLGNDLLTSVPLRSGIPQGASVYSEDLDQTHDSQHIHFRVLTTHLPARKAATVTYRGELWVKIGSDLQTVLIPHAMTTNRVFTIGPVTYSWTRFTADGAEFQTTQDPLLVRSLSMASADGRILSEQEPLLPRTFWSRTSAHDCRNLTVDNAHDLTIRATYFKTVQHYRIPFELTVPLAPAGR